MIQSNNVVMVIVIPWAP